MGGEVAARWERAATAVEVTYWSPSELDGAALQALLEYTMAQWSDGAGEGGFVVETARGELRVIPVADIAAAVVVQERDGRHVAPPSALFRAARVGDATGVSGALEAGEDPNVEAGGYSALQRAILVGSAKSACLLIDAGADLSKTDRLGHSLLQLVALSSDLDDQGSCVVARALVARGVRYASEPRIEEVHELAVARDKPSLAAVLRGEGRPNDRNPGRRVRGTVKRVEEYGLYLDFDDGEIIVLIPDVGEGPRELKLNWRVGAEVDVRIWRYIPSQGIYKGTIREAALDTPESGVRP